jgi:hypothetical protein
MKRRSSPSPSLEYERAARKARYAPAPQTEPVEPTESIGDYLAEIVKFQIDLVVVADEVPAADYPVWAAAYNYLIDIKRHALFPYEVAKPIKDPIMARLKISS